MGQTRLASMRTKSRHPFKPSTTLSALLLVTISVFIHIFSHVTPTSINYGVSHQPIKDISQLMPSLCQNQSVICEGSFCIPGLRKCVCDLRQPVQFGRFCLRQVDIETKCFVTNQCNHTIKDAVCLDLSNNVILDAETSKYKLEQWQHLNELRQASQTAISNKDSGRQQQPQQRQTTTTTISPVQMFLIDNAVRDESTFDARDDVMISNARNSPYEINYYTPELLQQNHTRRKTNSSDRSLNAILTGGDLGEAQNDNSQPGSSDNAIRSPSDEPSQPVTPLEMSTQSAVSSQSPPSSTTTTTTTQRTLTETLVSSTATTTVSDVLRTPSTPTQTSTSLPNESNKKRIVRPPNWPPGVCSCPTGYMFDSMLRKCLALSLADSHCQSDNDCGQIKMTHCSNESKKCDCDEPLVWNQTELACVRPKLKVLNSHNQPEKAVPTLLLTELIPDQSILLLIFIIVIIFSTIMIMWLFVKCLSSKKPTLISPKTQKHKKGNPNNNIPKSPYATLRKPEIPPNQMNSLTRAARGRILNYDFEQDNPIQPV